RDPNPGGTIGEVRAVSGRERALAARAVEYGLERHKLFKRRIAARKGVLGNPVDGHDEIGEEASLLPRDRTLVAVECDFVLLASADAPRLCHILAMLAHAPARCTILHFGNLEPDIPDPDFAEPCQALRRTPRFDNTPDPK